MGIRNELLETITNDQLHEACSHSMAALQEAGQQADPAEVISVLAGRQEGYAAFLGRFAGVLRHHLEAEGVTGDKADGRIRDALLGVHIVDQCDRAQQQGEARARIRGIAESPRQTPQPGEADATL